MRRAVDRKLCDPGFRSGVPLSSVPSLYRLETAADSVQSLKRYQMARRTVKKWRASTGIGAAVAQLDAARAGGRRFARRLLAVVRDDQLLRWRAQLPQQLGHGLRAFLAEREVVVARALGIGMGLDVQAQLRRRAQLGCMARQR